MCSSVERLATKYTVYDLTMTTFDKMMYDFFMCVICSFGGHVQNVGGVFWLKNLILIDHRVGGI